MVRVEEVTYLDTHVAASLQQGDLSSLSKEARRVIDRERDLRISPMVLLELEFMYEIKRARIPAAAALEKLKDDYGLRICDRPFEEIIREAAHEAWTRDPFDRIIVAQARIAQATLITRDTDMHARYAKALG